MSDMMEKLWPAFKAEVDEQLESIEQALIKAEQEQSIDIKQLFRDFHTLKSSFAMMGLTSMESIAHAAEDFLDEVRNERSRLDRDNVSLLLEALDALNSMLEEVETTKSDPAPASSLVEQLRSLAGEGHSHAGASDTDQSTEQQIPPELLAFLDFCDTLAGAFSIRNDALDVDAELAGHLAEKAAAAGFSAIETLLHQLPEADDRQLPEILSQLLARMEHVAELASQSSRLTTVHEVLRPWAAPALRAQLDKAEQALAPNQPGDRVLDQALHHGIQWSIIAGLPGSAQLLRLCRQVLRQYGREYRILGQQTVELISACFSIVSEQLETGPEDELFLSLVQQTTESLHQSISDQETASSLRERLEEAARQLRETPELLETLTESSSEHLINALERGDHIAEIDADLEEDRILAEKLAQWLSERAEVIDSRTVFVGGTRDGEGEKTRVRFLVAYAGNANELISSLEHMDPAGKYLKLFPCSFKKPESDQAGTETAATGRKSDSIRIDSERLDVFVSEIGQLMMLQNMLNHSLVEASPLSDHRQATNWAALLRRGTPLQDSDRRRLADFIDSVATSAGEIITTHEKMDTALQQLQNNVMDLRVVPVELLFSRLPRAVRNVSVAQGKEVRIDTEGAEVLVDKSIVDALVDPLIHMVRNSVDHAIESPEERERLGKPRAATLALSARSTGNSLILEIGDDGRGLDFDAIRRRALERGLATAEAIEAMAEQELAELIFAPGFSTSATVTETSGRGVGMDVVRSRVSQLGGRISVASKAGHGTSFRMTLPLSAAIQGVLLVRAGGQPVAIPERNVQEIIAVERSGIQTLQGQAAIIHQDIAVPVFDMHRLLYPQRPAPDTNGDGALEVVIVSNGKWRMGLVVEHVVGRQGIFVRDVHPEIANLPAVAGASVLGDGSVVIILDCDHLMTVAAGHAQSARSLLEAS